MEELAERNTHYALRPSSTDLCAIVIAYNEERHITACLETLTFADDRLVVLNTNTTDRTAELARAQGATVIEHPFVNFADQRNFALSISNATWVLFVDADERVTPALADEVRRVICETGHRKTQNFTENKGSDRPSSPVGYWIPRCNIIFGRWIQHTGWYPDHQLRLMRPDRARYDPAHPVHELVILDGPAGYLQEPFIHYNYETVAQFMTKMSRYTTLEAQILRDRGVRPKPWTPFLQPLREFYRRLVTYQGYKDGSHGLLLSLLMAYYTWKTYRRLQTQLG